MEATRKRYFLKFGIAIAVIGIAWFCLWFFYLSHYESTDDAYVHGNMIELNAQVSGTVVKICADETDFVRKDQILIELDPTDYEIAFEEAKANLATQVRKVENMYAQADSLKAAVKEAEAQLKTAAIDYENRAPLIHSGAISKEEFEHAVLSLEGANASFDKVYKSMQAQLALVENTTIEDHPLVVQAKDALRKAYVNLRRTKIVAPASGYVGMRKVQLGESVSAMTPMMAVVPLDSIWVDANFKETQLSKMRIGQRVTMHADMYGRSVTYYGTLVGLNPGTGNVFSLLPPQNATGNWIKIIQRVPVRVSLDSDAVQNNPLVLGMSMNATVSLSKQDGPQLARIPPAKPLYSTSVYEEQMSGVEEIIEEIMQKNVYASKDAT